MKQIPSTVGKVDRHLTVRPAREKVSVHVECVGGRFPCTAIDPNPLVAHGLRIWKNGLLLELSVQVVGVQPLGRKWQTGFVQIG